MGSPRSLADVEAAAAADPRAPLCVLFAGWRLEDYARTYFQDLTTSYPHLAARLPRMPDESVQRTYTGNLWSAQIEATVTFVRAVRSAYESASGRDLGDATVLDYGAGWGRFTRTMLQIVPDDRVFAADIPSGADLFDGLGFPNRCLRVEAASTRLPVDDARFDLIWMYSVLTHLPLAGADAVMSELRRALRPDGLLAMTVRPIEFWHRLADAAMAAEHEATGFAHRSLREGWGDTSISLEFLRQRWTAWSVYGTAWHAPDPASTIVYLRPR